MIGGHLLPFEVRRSVRKNNLMRKLWPPTYDDFSIRVWAAIVSLVTNSVLWTLALSRSETAFWLLLFPGLFPAPVLGCVFADRCTFVYVASCVLTELVFDYLIP